MSARGSDHFYDEEVAPMVKTVRADILNGAPYKR